MRDLFNCKLHRFFERTISVVGEGDLPAIERFISDFDAYTKSVILASEDRSDHQRTVDDYITLRRDTCGAKLTFSFFALGLNVPNSVFDNSFMISLIENAADLIAIINVSHLDTTLRGG